MPTLNQVRVTIECGPNNIKLREHQVQYSDGFVSSYVAVPTQHKAFNIHVTSEGYIAPGLAIFVFIDGVAQCNRYRADLIIPERGSKKEETEVEFRLRQKEEKFADGKWLGRQWEFADLDVGQYSAVSGTPTR